MFYAVKSGPNPGVYSSLKDAKLKNNNLENVEWEKFKDKSDALDYIKHSLESENVEINSKEVYAFVDGSFNAKTNVYGWGGFLVINHPDENGEYNNKQMIEIKGSGNDEDLATMRNVAGEILGSTEAIKKALELNEKYISIYYDYLGIEMWAKGIWKRNKDGTKAYYDFIQSVKDKISIKFIKVKAHSGIDGNEEADRLAKEAVGII